jgi:hypothetical protein
MVLGEERMKGTYGRHRYSGIIVNGVRFWLVLLLLLSSFGPVLVSADVVWSDNFDDGDFDGWTISSPSWGNPPSNWSAANYYLQIEQEAWGSISHPSNVAYGTWSFDFKANGTYLNYDRGVSIAFVSNDVHNGTEVPTGNDWSCYGLKAYGTYEGTGFRLCLLRWHDGVRHDIDSNEIPLSLTDWHHIDVSRTTDGLFHVYHNGSLVMQGVDTELTTSELFVVSLVDWLTIDNVVVDDAPPFDWVLIGIGTSAVVIIAVLVIILKRR